jgi:4-hydroxybenzoate polyprenyltransferase
MNKFLLLIKVSRPLSWAVFPLVFLLGLIVSGNISGSITITPLAILQILLLSFPYCTFLYGINDVYDFEADQINPKKRKDGGRIHRRKRIRTSIPFLYQESFISRYFTTVFNIFFNVKYR